MLGTDFARTLRAAQAGEEDAFVRLWRDANPAMIRYLRVVGHDDPYDEACEGWITVVRGLPGFAGDELAWRVWVLACARQRAEESTIRRAWGSVTVLPGIQVEGDGEIDIDELLDPDEVGDPAHRGINDTLAALRALPLGQGEVVVLHLGAGLPTAAVADVVGVDEVNIDRAEARALERLGTDVGLLSWSLAAPATPAELADEQVALSAFRKILPRGRQPQRAKVISLGLGSGLGSSRASSRGSTPAPSPASSRGSSHSPGPAVSLGPGFGSTGVAPGDSARRRPERARRADRIRGGEAGRHTDLSAMRGRHVRAAGRSRTAILTVAALSVSAISLGGLGAAAYVGVLPDQVQQVMHDAIGAPAPKGGDNGSAQNPGSQPVTPPTAAVGPDAANSPAAGLCRAWAVDKAKGTPRDRSVAFRNLSDTAGGADKVEAYCAVVLTAKPTKGSPTAGNGATHTAKPRPTNTPSSPATKAPNTRTTATKAPNSNSPTRSETLPGKGKTARTGASTSDATSAATAADSTAADAPGTEPTTDRQVPNQRSTSKAR